MTAESSPCSPSEFWGDDDLTPSEQATVATIREARAIAGVRTPRPSLAEHEAQQLALAQDTLRLRTEALHRVTTQRDEARAEAEIRFRELLALRSGIEAIVNKGLNDDWRNAGRDALHEIASLLAAPSTPSSATGTRAAPEGTPGGSEAQEGSEGIVEQLRACGKGPCCSYDGHEGRCVL